MIVLLTDGENNENPDPLTRGASRRRLRCAHLHGRHRQPRRGAMHVNGFTVQTQLDEATLQQIAQLTDGTYYNAESEQTCSTFLKPDPPTGHRAGKDRGYFALCRLWHLVLLVGGCFALWLNRLPAQPTNVRRYKWSNPWIYFGPASFLLLQPSP